MAVVWAVRYFHAYLWGRRFTIRTDHNSLQWLKSFNDPQGQVARWLDMLAEYDFQIQHRPGAKHGNADALSRLPSSNVVWQPHPHIVKRIWLQKNHMLLKDGILYRQWLDVPGGGSNRHLQLVVPKSWIRSVLKQYHDVCSGSHFGTRKTLEKIRFRFYWPGQRHDVENWCKRCEKCASRKSHPKPGELNFKLTWLAIHCSELLWTYSDPCR